MVGHFKLTEVFSSSQIRYIPSTLQTVEDVALASWDEIPIKRGYDFVNAAQRFLTKKIVRRMVREGDTVKVILKYRTEYPPEVARKLFHRIATLFVKLYSEEKLTFKQASDLEYTFAAQNLNAWDRQNFESFTEETFEEGMEEETVQEVQAKVIVPHDMFDLVIGYEDVKLILMRSLESDRPVHTLFVGPPASAKTVFLLEIERVFGPRARYALGGGATKAGIAELLFAEKPQYLLVDEMDKMSAEDYSVLLSLCETGIVSETKYGKTRQEQLNTRVYAAANRVDKVPPEVLSRFLKFQFSQYTRFEFQEVVANILTKREGSTQELAHYIADKLSSDFTQVDVRDAIRIARLASTKEEVDQLLKTMTRYGMR